MIGQELQEVLYSEEKNFKRLKQLKAFFKYSKKFCDRKFKLVESILEEPDKLDLLRNAVYENERSLLRRIFKRKEVLNKRKFFDAQTQEIYDKIVALFNQISDILARQLNVVNTDVEGAYHESHVIQKFLDSSFVSKLDPNSRRTIIMLISKQKTEFADLVKKISDLRHTLINQQDTIVMIHKQAESNRSIYGAIHITLDSLRECVHSEEKQYEPLFGLIDVISGELQEIIDEGRLLAEIYPTTTLLQLPADIIEIIKREKEKTGVVQKYLESQRAFRNGINPKTLVAVHLTKFLPENGFLKTTAKARETNGELKFPRETIHFSLNGPVTDLPFFGEWVNTKYAIVIPMEKVIDRFINLSPNDSFIFGALEIPLGSWFLVPAANGNAQQLRAAYKKHVPNAEIDFRREGEDIRGHVYRIIIALGYSPMRIGQWGWAGPLTEKARIAISEYLNNSNMAGFDTAYSEFAASLQKEIVEHDNTFWKGIENIAFRYLSMLNRDYTLQKFMNEEGKLDVEGLKKEIGYLEGTAMNYYRDLRNRCKNMKDKEELHAYVRAASFLKDCYEKIKKVYKPYLS